MCVSILPGQSRKGCVSIQHYYYHYTTTEVPYAIPHNTINTHHPAQHFYCTPSHTTPLPPQNATTTHHTSSHATPPLPYTIPHNTPTTRHISPHTTPLLHTLHHPITTPLPPHNATTTHHTPSHTTLLLLQHYQHRSQLPHTTPCNTTFTNYRCGPTAIPYKTTATTTLPAP